MANPPAAKGACKGAVELEGCYSKGPKHATTVLSSAGLAFGSVLPEDPQLHSPLGAVLPAEQNCLEFGKINRPPTLELGVLG